MQMTEDKMQKIVGALKAQKDSFTLRGLDIKYNSKDDSIKIQRDSKFMPQVFCDVKEDPKTSQFKFICNLPLLQLVQKMAQKGIYLDDTKPDQIKALLQQQFNQNVAFNGLDVSISYPHTTWISYPRSLTVIAKKPATDKVKEVCDSSLIFVRIIRYAMKTIETNYSKYLVVNKLTKVDAK